MNVDSIKSLVLGLPEVAAWPDMAGIFERTAAQLGRDWELPFLACRAVGGESSLAAPGAAAIACIQLAIVLVDDMLDEDPRGDYHRLGHGPTANLALAFQAAALRLAAQSSVDAERQAAIAASLADIGLGTALGQHLDAQNQGNEADYWKVVRAKSAPFYGNALYIGALLGKADLQVAGRLRDFGVLIGELAQIYDDLLDAFQSPAKPDWKRGRNSLPILYALTADHPARARFMELLPQVYDPQALREAQQILIACGAVSYCAYQATQRYQTARRLLESLPLADLGPMTDALGRQSKPLIGLFQRACVEVPADLFTR